MSTSLLMRAAEINSDPSWPDPRFKGCFDYSPRKQIRITPIYLSKIESEFIIKKFEDLKTKFL